MNNIQKDLLNRVIKTIFGLFIFSIGSYLTIIADIGLTPWDSLSMSISYHVPFSFGFVHVASALLIAVIDLLLKEKIGVGTLLDALLVGTFIDCFTSGADRIHRNTDKKGYSISFFR